MLQKFILSLSMLLLSTLSISAVNYSWNTVKIGGGGFVSGIIASETESGLFYARTDVGGFYKWDNQASKWIALTDWISEADKDYYGIESVALDYNNSSNVYALAGLYYNGAGKTAILKSTDYGATFQVTEVSTQFKTHGNGVGRQNGERLAVDPNKSSILFCGTRNDGLFKSTNSGVSWSKVTSFPVATTSNGNGICSIVFDKSSSSNGTATSRIFAAVSQSGTSNVYVSNNGGTSWSALSGQSTSYMPQTMKIYKGNLYITYANGAGPSITGSTGEIYQYNIIGSSWKEISPSSEGFGGIDVVDVNGNTRIVASTISVWAQQANGSYGDKIYVSENGGTSWTDLVGSKKFKMSENGFPWIKGKSIHWAGDITIDPFNPKKVFVTSGNGLFLANDITASTVDFNFTVNGLEETVPLDLVSIPGGNMISVIGDYDGFVHTDLSISQNIHTPNMGTCTGLAYASKSTSKLVRCGEVLQYSTNGGTSWTQMSNPSTKKNGKGKIALSADGTTILWAHEDSTAMYRSTNNGSSWSPVTSISYSGIFPVADKVNSNYFYAVDRKSGDLYVSSNKGTSFTKYSGKTNAWSSPRIQTVEGHEGHIWLASSWEGLKKSTDHGATFSTVSSGVVTAVGIGKAAPSSSYPTIYVWGSGLSNADASTLGVYRSIDGGNSWNRVNDDNHQYAGPGNGEFIIGDYNVYGRVFMSTAGRGIAFGEIYDITAIEGFAPFAKVGYAITIAPNPIKEGTDFSINIKAKEDNAVVELYNFKGTKLSAFKAKNSEEKLNAMNLQAGIYHIILKNSDDTNAITTFTVVK